VEGRAAGDMDTAGHSIDVQTRSQKLKAILKPREELVDPRSVHIPRIVGCYGIGVYNDDTD
jgi:hypothetical protein